MDSLNYKHHEPAKLDVVYDREIATPTPSPLQGTHLAVPSAPSSHELDQELENLLSLMGETTTPQVPQVQQPPPQHRTTRRLNPDDIKPRRLNYQVPTYTHNKYDKELPTDSSSNRFDYEVDTRDSSFNFEHSSTRDRYNYRPTDSNSYNYQVVDKTEGKFNYQSDCTKSQFNHKPTHQNYYDRFDYKPTTNSSKFNRPIPTANKFDSVPARSQDYSTLPHAQNNLGSSSHGRAVLDVEVGENTRVRLEVGASASAGDGWGASSAYAKATIYRRG